MNSLSYFPVILMFIIDKKEKRFSFIEYVISMYIYVVGRFGIEKMDVEKTIVVIQ